MGHMHGIVVLITGRRRLIVLVLVAVFVCNILSL